MTSGTGTGAGLVVLGGLPGVGKTTIARLLAQACDAAHVRVDTLEWALVRLGLVDEQHIDASGYALGYAVAADQLAVGRPVVADSVNPVAATRDAWRELAVSRGLPVAEVEVVCSVPAVHQDRVVLRTPDIEGATLPTWGEVTGREMEPWDPDLTIDTAEHTPEQAVALIVAHHSWLKRRSDV